LGYLRPEEDRERYAHSYLWNSIGEIQPPDATDDEWNAAFAEFEALLPLAGPVAQALDEGRIADELAPALSRVTYPEPGTIGYPDQAALCAAYVLELVRLPAALAVCPSCQAPWVPAETSPAEFCDRPSLGRSDTCASYARQERFRQRHPAYDRERKKIYQRVSRGTLSQETYREWLETQTPDDWTPFDEWVKHNIPY
jgi:hypothetical protein